MESVIIDKDSEVLLINFDTEESAKFPFVWLRDNCQCSQCFHPVSHGRLFLLRDLSLTIAPLTAELTNDNKLLITWPDEHRSTYTSEWLTQHIFNERVRQAEEQSLHLTERLWTSRDMSDIPRVTYKQLMEDDNTVLKWLTHLEQDGICLVVQAPARKGVYHDISKRVAHPKRTFYGEMFSVERKKNPNNVAYTSACLGLHTDQPQLYYTPGVQLLHCIQQAGDGGANIFTDAFQVALDLQQEHPAMYSALCNTPVQFHDHGVEGTTSFKMKTQMYTFERDRSGRVHKVNYNNQIRASVMTISVEGVKEFYKALKQYETMLMDPTYCIRYKMNDGEIVCFHNYRVMHGREAYRITGEEERLLEGWYYDWDELKSRRRVLQDQSSP